MIEKLKKASVWLRDAWLILGITVLFLIILEIASSLFLYRRHAHYMSDSRATADTYGNQPWPNKYYEELNETYKMQWQPYVYWRRKPYQSEYINIDSLGIRKTWTSNIGWEDKSIRPKIFFFGGSAIWGSGARDEFTIPSIFAKQLVAKGISPNITNYAENGYVSTQEVILLIRELQKGNIPDLVIFYDGVNDIFSAYQQQSAGLPQNEFNREEEFNLSKRISNVQLLSYFANKLASVQVLRRILYRMNIGEPLDNEGQFYSFDTLKYSSAPKEHLENDVLKIYEQNIAFVESIAKRYSFRTLFYWQPVVFDKQHLTEYEQLQKQKKLFLQPIFETSYELLKQHNLERNGHDDFHNLSNVFSEVNQPLFIDWCHLGESGNAFIADRMSMDALSIMNRKLSVKRK